MDTKMLELSNFTFFKVVLIGYRQLSRMKISNKAL